MLKYEKYLFHALVLLALSIIIIPKYYITGDGASHVYNSKVLFDYLFGHERVFYKEFYQMNRSVDANISSHILLGIFLQIFPSWFAEKLFQILYVLVFAYGLRNLIITINPKNTFYSFLFFPFLFSLPFQEGFYNYVLSVAIMFWTVAYYIKNKNDFQSAKQQLVLYFLLLAMVYTHGMPTIFSLMIIGLLWVMDNRYYFYPLNLKKIIVSFSKLAIVLLPIGIQIASFIIKSGFEKVPHSLSKTDKFILFLNMYTFQSTRNLEKYPAMAVGILLLIFLFIYFFTTKNKSTKNTSTSYVFLIMAIYTFYYFITCPHSIGGAGSIDIRLAFLPPLFLILFLSTKYWNDTCKKIFILMSFIISISFLSIRFPYVLKANTIGQEMMTASEKIDDKSVVLNLHFNDWQPLISGDSLFQKDGSFIHFTDFLGAEKNKHLIMLMNYEAEIYYFPVNWRQNINPRESIPTMIPGNYPPCGNYHLYENFSGKKIDYILLQNWNEKYMTQPCVDTMIKSLNENFYKIFESKNSYVVLFQRK